MQRIGENHSNPSKNGELMENQLTQFSKIIESKVLPMLGTRNISLSTNSLDEILLTFINTSVKNEREIKLANEKLGGELNDITILYNNLIQDFRAL